MLTMAFTGKPDETSASREARRWAQIITLDVNHAIRYHAL